MNLVQLESILWRDNPVYNAVKEAITTQKPHIHFIDGKLVSSTEVTPDKYVFRVATNNPVLESLRFYKEIHEANRLHREQNLANIKKAIDDLT